MALDIVFPALTYVEKANFHVNFESLCRESANSRCSAKGEQVSNWAFRHWRKSNALSLKPVLLESLLVNEIRFVLFDTLPSKDPMLPKIQLAASSVLIIVH